MKTTIHVLLVLCLIACGTSVPTKSVNTDSAQFIFRGSVEQIQAANLPEIRDTENTIVVKVDEVVYAPLGFEDWTGKSITVAVNKAIEIKPETNRLFYTNGWLYGKSLAVIEVGDGDVKDLSNEEVLEGVAGHQDDDVRERLKLADVVVVGGIKDIKEGSREQRISEHNPVWADVVINVDTFLKGDVTGNELSFSYPTSRDVMWADAPEFDKGQQGIWLLQRSGILDGEFTITEAHNFFDIRRLEYIETLLK